MLDLAYGMTFCRSRHPVSNVDVQVRELARLIENHGPGRSANVTEIYVNNYVSLKPRLQKSVRYAMLSDKQSESPHKREAKQEDETLATGITHTRRALPNTPVLGCVAELPFPRAGMDNEMY
jgi:hypothetical protein